jgi:hypothetical protein
MVLLAMLSTAHLACWNNMKELKSKVSPKAAATQPFRVVLHKNAKGEWVTHLENVVWSDDGDGGFVSKDRPDYYWGHYFDNYDEARKDYHLRRKKYNL